MSGSLRVETGNAAPAVDWRKTSIILGATVGLAFGYPAVYFGTLSVFLKPVAGEFGWARAETSSIVTMAMLGFAVGCPLVGALIDRYGPRSVIAGSAVLFSVLVFTCSQMSGNRAAWAATSFMIGLLGVGTGPGGYLCVLPRSFDKRLGMALSFAMAGAGAGSAAMPIITQGIIGAQGWRMGYQGLAVISLLGAIVAFLLLGAKPTGRSRALPVQVLDFGDTLAEALRTWRFWALFAVLLVVTSAGLGATVHIVPLLTDRGIAAGRAAQVAGLVGFGLLVGRFGAGFLMDVLFAPLVGALAFVAGAVGLVALAFASASTDFAVLAVSAALFGLTLGAEGDLVAYVARRYFGMKAFGKIYGALLVAYSLGGVVGPILFGLSFDRTGSYGTALAAGAVGTVLSAAAIVSIGRYRYGVAGQAA